MLSNPGFATPGRQPPRRGSAMAADRSPARRGQAAIARVLSLHARAATVCFALAMNSTAALCGSLSVRNAGGDQWRAISDTADGAQGYLLEHLGPDGSLDRKFGRGGHRPIAISATDDAPTAIRVDARGRIWVTGASVAGGEPQAVVLRFLSDGTPDIQWGVQGRIQISPNGLAIKPNDLLPLSDGSLLVAGVASNVEPARAAVFHLKADGLLDASFGGSGTWQPTIVNDGSTATAFAASDDGAVAVSVVALGDPPVAEIWALTDRAPKPLRQQSLDKVSDAESVGVAWSSAGWALAPSSGPTAAGLFATIEPAAAAAASGRSASAPPDLGRGGFSPFAADTEPASSTTTETADVGNSAGTLKLVAWLSFLAAAVAAGFSVLWKRRIGRVVRRPRNPDL